MDDGRANDQPPASHAPGGEQNVAGACIFVDINNREYGDTASSHAPGE